MKKMLVATMILLALGGCATKSQNNSDILERNIGKLALSHNQKFSYKNGLNPFGSSIMHDEFEKIYYSKIKGLPVEDRINYFWFAMWHLNFVGHGMMEFEKLVEEDCGDQFIARLEKYIETESKLKRHKGRLHLSKKVLIGIKDAKANRKKFKIE